MNALITWQVAMGTSQRVLLDLFVFYIDVHIQGEAEHAKVYMKPVQLTFNESIQLDLVQLSSITLALD